MTHHRTVRLTVAAGDYSPVAPRAIGSEVRSSRPTGGDGLYLPGPWSQHVTNRNLRGWRRSTGSVRLPGSAGPRKPSGRQEEPHCQLGSLETTFRPEQVSKSEHLLSAHDSLPPVGLPATQLLTKRWRPLHNAGATLPARDSRALSPTSASRKGAYSRQVLQGVQ